MPDEYPNDWKPIYPTRAEQEVLQCDACDYITEATPAGHPCPKFPCGGKIQATIAHVHHFYDGFCECGNRWDDPR